MNKSNGFTLVELMVVIAIASILLTLGIPSMNRFVASSRVVTAANDMVYMVTLARSEAIKRRQPDDKPVSIIRKASGFGNDWSGGVILFVDNNDNQKFDSGDEKIQETPSLKSGISLTMVSPTTGDERKAIVFSSRGVPGSAYRFDVCEASGLVDVSRERVLSLNISGRPNVKPASDTFTPAPCA